MAKTNIALRQTAEAAAKRKAKLLAEIPEVPKPGYDIPKVPVRVSELSDDELMRLFVALTRWTDYYNGQVAMAAVDESAAETVLEKAKALVLLGKWAHATKDDRITVAKAEVATDPEVEEWQAEYDQAYARRKLLSVLFENAERDAALVSRELTRRVGRQEVSDRRASRWSA